MFCAAVGDIAAQNFDVAPALRRHVEYLSSDALQGRKAGSEGERKAAAYLHSELEKAGVVMLTDVSGQDFTIDYGGEKVSSLNIVGIVEGSDPRLREEYIVVGAHLDNIGTHSMTVNGQKVTQVYPGADDNASGVAMMIELAGMVAANSWAFPRSVIFVGFGAQECGMAGSWYFVNRAFEQIGQVKAMVDLDMLGRGNDANPFQIFSQVDASALSAFMKKVAEQPVVTAPVRAQGALAPSDYLPFYERKIPVVLFTTGMTHEYHTVKDTPSLVLYNHMARNSCYIYHFISCLSSQEDVFARETKVLKATAETIYSPSDCDKRPQFFHSDEQHFLDAWVYKYIKYPKAALRNGIMGQVLVGFIVEKDGRVTNVEVVKGVDDDLDDEAVKVISVSPKWIPGEVAGRKVRTRIILPVEFRLRQ